MITRRLFVRSAAFALVGFGAGPSFLHRAALASDGGGSRRKILVTVFLRGAMDGLAAVAPVGDPGLVRLRPRLALPAGRVAGENTPLDLGDGFALHPALAPLAPLYRQGHLAVVHGVASPDPTRSHFDAQDYMEAGTPGVGTTASGWLDRAVGLAGHDARAASSPVTVSALRAVSLTEALPRSLQGPRPAVAIRDLEEFARRGAALEGDALARLWDGDALGSGASGAALAGASAAARDAARVLSAEEVRSYRPAAGARYPASALGESLRQVALLIKAGVGLEVAFAESDGWDTHVRQGAAEGSFARRARDLARSLEAFWRDLGSHRNDVVVLTMTEFGRTVAENGSGGTDHGHASCLFVLGGPVDGGRVLGGLPAMDRDALFEGRDLPLAVDFRSVFAGVAGEHLGVDRSRDGELFPGWRGERLALLHS